jgi:hypothetical protein
MTTEKETFMQRNIASRTFTLISLAGLLVCLAPAAHAGSCSLARAAGNYGVSDSGTVVGIGPRVAIGLVTLDAAGNLTGKVTASLNGTVTESTASGTYSVNPDCTGLANISEFDQSGNLLLTATESAVWDDNMRELRLIFTSAKLPNGTSLAAVISGTARKLVP